MLPAIGVAGHDDDSEDVVDEIVVLGRSVATASAAIDVEREVTVDTASLLRKLPGADVNSNGSITQIAQYRGMFGERVAVDVDALPVVGGGPNAMDTPLSYVSPMLVDSVALARGIPSVSLASEAIGGYLGATLARGDFGGETPGVSGMLGSRYTGNGAISTSAGRLTLANQSHRLTAMAEIDTGNDVDTPEGRIRPTELRRERYDASYAYRDQGLELLLFAGALDTEDTGTPALPMDIGVIDTDLYGVQVELDRFAGVAIRGRVAHNDVFHTMDNFSLREAPPPMMQRVNTARGRGTMFDISAVIDYGVTRLTLGVDGQLATHESLITNPNAAAFAVQNFNAVDRDLLGTYAQWNLPVNGSDVEIGVRFNRIETDAGEVGAAGLPGMMAMAAASLAADFNSARRGQHWNTVDAVLKLRRDWSERSEWTVEIGSRSRAPSYQELYLWLPLQATAGLADGRSYIGNLGLDEERSAEIVFGFTSIGDRFAFSPQAYYREIDDYIQGVPSANDTANRVAMMMTGSLPLQFANVDARIWGLDAAWRYAISDRWLADGVLSIVRGRRADIDDNLYRLPPHNARLSLTYSGRDWHWTTEVVAYASQARVAAFNDERETAGYAVLNLGYAWNPHPAVRVEARVENLLDESYQDHLAGINRARGSDIPVGERLVGTGRAVTAGLVYSF